MTVVTIVDLRSHHRIAVRTRKENEELVQVFRKILKPAERRN
ncbi:MAG: hypothetical protein V8T31_02555 [Lachnospiraceae bacterium]